MCDEPTRASCGAEELNQDFEHWKHFPAPYPLPPSKPYGHSVPERTLICLVESFRGGLDVKQRLGGEAGRSQFLAEEM